jgi:hypothetical protein
MQDERFPRIRVPAAAARRPPGRQATGEFEHLSYLATRRRWQHPVGLRPAALRKRRWKVRSSEAAQLTATRSSDGIAEDFMLRDAGKDGKERLKHEQAELCQTDFLSNVVAFPDVRLVFEDLRRAGYGGPSATAILMGAAATCWDMARPAARIQFGARLPP